VPEAPELEALAGFLRDRALGRQVRRLTLVAVSALKTWQPPLDSLNGERVEAVERYGKFLALQVGPRYLVVHLARAGWLRWVEQVPTGRPARGPLALRVDLGGCGIEFTEAGTHKGLAVYLVAQPDAVPGIAALGPDALDPTFDVEALAAGLAGARTQLKGWLRDQTRLAGIGNAYSDEILHAAGLSPFRPAGSLDPPEIQRLHAAIREVLAAGVARCAGCPPGEMKEAKRAGMAVHGRTGEPCPVCGERIGEVSFAESRLQYCPTCQTGGRLLADRRLSRLLR
jgi:formamidopyrimidine-DNA glycosylase